MATRLIPPLIADGGDMTVMRFVASHAFGKISVTLPEGVEAEDSDLDQAYSYKLRGGEVSPFGRRFIRADLDIDAENNVSTVEEVLDDVTNRTAGEALFQQDFTRAALGRLELGVDFNVGDLVPVRRWGRILENQLVTAADDLSTPDDPFGVRVHVGGQLIREPAPLAQRNRDIAREIAQERKERLAQVKAVDQKASDAKSTAESAEVTAGDALRAATDADGVIAGKLEEARGHAENALGSAEQASNFADEADRLNDEVKASKLLVDQAVATGRSYVSSAASQAGLALVSVQEAREQVELARGYNAEIAANVQIAQQAVVDGKAEVTKAKAEVTKAQNASSAAGDALSSAQAVKVDVDASAADVQAALVQVVNYHGEVLQAHDEAISAATSAADAATQASDRALDAANANTSALAAVQQANEHRDAAISAASDAAGQAATAANSAASAAGEALEATRVLGEIAGKQTEINESLSKGVRAAASAAAQASVATMMNSQAIEQVAIATQKALDAAAENASAIASAQTAANEALAASNSAQDAAQARDATLTNVAELAWLSHFRRPRIAYFDKNVNGQTFATNLYFDDGSPSFYVNVNAERLWLSKRGTWSGTMKVQVMTTTSAFGMLSRTYNVGSDGTEEWHANFGDAVWQRFIVELYPEFPDAAAKAKFEAQAVSYLPLK